MPLPNTPSSTIAFSGFGRSLTPGPFLIGGNTYVFGRDAVDNSIDIWYAADPGGVWTAGGTWVITNTIRAWDAVAIGGTIYVMASVDSLGLLWNTYDTATQTWGTHVNLSSSRMQGAPVNLVVRSSSEIVAFYTNAFTTMGKDHGRTIARSYNVTTATWGAEIATDAGGTSTSLSYISVSAALGADGRVHLFLHQIQGANALHHRVLSSTNSLTALSASILGDATTAVVEGGSFGRGVSYVDGTVTRCVIPVSRGATTAARLNALRFTSADAPTFTTEAIGDVAPSDPAAVGNLPPMSIAAEGTKLHALYATSAGTLNRDVNTGAGWGADTEITGAAATRVSSFVYDRSGLKLAFVYANGTGAIAYDEIALAAPVTDPPVAQVLTGTVAGAATASGSIAAQVAANGTAAGASTTSGTAAALVALSGTAAGAGTASGTISTATAPIAQALTGTVAGTSTTAGALLVSQPITGTAAGSATTSGTLLVWQALSGTAAGSGTASGNVTTGTAPTPQALTGTAAGTATTSGSIAARAVLSGTAAGTATTSGTTTARAALTGTAAGAGTSTGTHALRIALTATAAGSGTISGGLTTGTLQPLSGTVASTSSTAGALNAVARLSATDAGAGTAAGTVTLFTFVYLSGTATGVGALLGAPVLWLSIIGTAAGAGAVTGTITARTAGALDGPLPIRNRVRSEPDGIIGGRPDGVVQSGSDGVVTSRPGGVLISARG